MAFILCIETATPVCSVALFENNTLLSLYEIKDGNTHASALTGLIKQCMDEAKISFSQLDAIAVSKGPGSYTGLRVGIATAKGLCYTSKKPLIAIGTLKSLANIFMLENPGYTGLICPMIDARRMEVYTALYNHELKELSPVEAKIIDSSSYAEELAHSRIAFLGSGSEKCSETITSENALFTYAICSSKGMGILAHEKFMAKEFQDLAYFEPDYLKEFVGKKGD
ncbi:MAG: tRNA (adenosine(37)-N6)-threonylcarbamoyltransferase complex dimerization subunit type 1 TsaB [Bacteroidota bacterium]